MTTDLTMTLTALIEHWNMLAKDAAEKIAATPDRTLAAYCAGVMFGVESSRDDLITVLANALAETTKP